MRYVLALALPPASFLRVGKPVQAVVSSILCLTVFGWPAAALWALFVEREANAYRRSRDEFIRSALPRRTLAVIAEQRETA